MAAQFTRMKGRALRGLARWICSAKSSLPTPLSPRSSTEESVSAALRAISSRSLMIRLSPMKVCQPSTAWTLSCRALSSLRTFW